MLVHMTGEVEEDFSCDREKDIRIYENRGTTMLPKFVDKDEVNTTFFVVTLQQPRKK